MPLTQDHDMIQAVALERPNQPLRIGVLPRRPRGYRAVTNAHRPNASQEGLPVRPVIVTYQVGRCRIPRECLNDCCASHSAVGCLVTANHSNCRRPWPTTRNANSCSKVRVGITQRSIAAMASAWLRRKIRHVCDGAPWRMTMYLETVDSAIS